MYANQDYFRYVPKSAAISVQKMACQHPYTQKYVHMHGHAELLLITSHAKVTIFNNGNKQEVRSPALILHQAGSYHGTEAPEIGTEGYLSYCVFFSEHSLKKVPASVLQTDALFSDQCVIAELEEEQCKRLAEYAERLRGESTGEKSLLLLLLLLAEAKEAQAKGSAIRLNNPNNYIFDVTQYLVKHPDEPLTTAQLAARFHVSVSKLNADFQQITNQTPKAFSTDLRIARAAELLCAQPKTPLAQIAYQCGFSSESYLIQCFQKKLGVTPTAYRKAHKDTTHGG